MTVSGNVNRAKEQLIKLFSQLHIELLGFDLKR